MTTPGFRILPSAPRPSQQILERLKKLPAANLSDNMGRHQGACADMRPYHRGAKMVGPAFTVKAPPGDNLMVHKAIDMAAPGDVIVVDAGGNLDHAIIGEIMSSLAAKRGVAGLVIDGAIRDRDEIAASDFPVYARGVTHRGPYKDGPGEINVPVSIGGMVVHPGDYVVGDGDGVLAISRDVIEEVLRAAEAQNAKEQATLKAIADGTIDRKWVDEALKQKGCRLP